MRIFGGSDDLNTNELNYIVHTSQNPHINTTIFQHISFPRDIRCQIKPLIIQPINHHDFLISNYIHPFHTPRDKLKNREEYPALTLFICAPQHSIPFPILGVWLHVSFPILAVPSRNSGHLANTHSHCLFQGLVDSGVNAV